MATAVTQQVAPFTLSTLLVEFFGQAERAGITFANARVAGDAAERYADERAKAFGLTLTYRDRLSVGIEAACEFNRRAASTPPASESTHGPECPKCGYSMHDNRPYRRNPKAPDWKCKSRSCDGVIWPERESVTV
jgi:hypothetical protein